MFHSIGINQLFILKVKNACLGNCSFSSDDESSQINIVCRLNKQVLSHLQL